MIPDQKLNLSPLNHRLQIQWRCSFGLKVPVQGDTKLVVHYALTMENGYLAIHAHQQLPTPIPYHLVIMLMGLEQIETCYNLKYNRHKIMKI